MTTAARASPVASGGETPERLVGVIGVGVVALLSQGLLPALLGALGSAGRMGLSGIGLAVAAESLAITIVSALAAAIIRPRRLRRIGVLAALALTGSTLFAGFAVSETQQILLRAGAGVAEGFLFWIALEGVARAAVPARAAGLLMASVTVVTLAANAVLTEFILPDFGPAGGFIALGAASLIGALMALSLNLIEPPADDRHEARTVVSLPGLQGGLALVAALLFNAAGMGFLVFAVPLAAGAGLSEAVAGRGLTALIAGQLGGAVVATMIAGRANHVVMLVLSAAGYLAIWPAFAFHPSAGLFVGLEATHGFVTFLALPFLYPLMILADSSQRAAVLIGPAQMLGTAAGPLLGAAVLARGPIFNLVPLGIGLLIVAMLLMVALWLTVRPAAYRSAG